MIARFVLGLACCALVAGDSATPPVFVDRALVRYHMKQHLDDLQTVERLLVAGDLDAARSLAFMLSKPEADPGMAPWAAEAREVANAARALTAARTLDEALRREAAIAAACAGCHVRSGQLPQFEPLGDPPPAGSQMERHQWAVDRLWEGMIGASDERWRAGLHVVAATPAPPAAAPAAARFGAQLQALARAALANRAKPAIASRARLYGEMLVACSGCHAAVRALAE